MPTNKPKLAPKTIPPRLLYTRDEARTLLGGISESTLHKLMRDGKLEYVKVLRRTGITADSIKRVAEKGA